MRSLPASLLFFLLLTTLCCCNNQAIAGEHRPDDLQFKPLEFTIKYPQKFNLSNGIAVYYKQDSELPLLDVTVSVCAGKVGVEPNKAGVSALMALLLRSGGAGQWTAEQLDQHIEDLAATVHVSTGPYTTDFNLSLLSEDARSGLQLLAALVRHPRFAPQRFEIGRQQLLEAIRRRGDRAAGLAQQVMMERLYAGHPLARFPTLKSVAALSVDDVKQEYGRYFAPNNTRIVISGALSAQQAQRWLEQTFGDWSGSAATQVVPPLVTHKLAGTVLVDRPLTQTTVMLTQLGIEKNNPDLYAIQVMNFILGGGGFSSRLMREIRSNRGLAYSVYSYFSVGRQLTGPFIAGCETKNNSVAQVVELLRSGMEQMGNQPVSQEELHQAKDSLLNSFVFTFDDSHALAQRIMEQELFGYPPLYLEQYRQNIAAVSIADVQRVARKYLHTDQQLLILIGDKQQLQPQLKGLGGTVEEVPLASLL